MICLPSGAGTKRGDGGGDDGGDGDGSSDGDGADPGDSSSSEECVPEPDDEMGMRPHVADEQHFGDAWGALLAELDSREGGQAAAQVPIPTEAESGLRGIGVPDTDPLLAPAALAF